MLQCVSQRREFPTDPADWSTNASWGRSTTGVRPLTDIEALMELAPHEESTVQSILGTAALKEAIGVAVDNLNEEDKWIFNALFVEQLSLRAAGRVMGIPKTSLARRRDYIRRRLIAELAESEIVSGWLMDGLGLQRLHTLA